LSIGHEDALNRWRVELLNRHWAPSWYEAVRARPLVGGAFGSAMQVGRGHCYEPPVSWERGAVEEWRQIGIARGRRGEVRTGRDRTANEKQARKAHLSTHKYTLQG
jgi:hypothetical protein